MTIEPVETPVAGATSVHIINHTHWDREWFLTHEYTTAWIPDLIDALDDRVAENDAYEYLFDGQTLVIEDLLAIRPEYRDRVERLVSSGTLGVGPVYSQADWRIVSGQLHVRNLQYGTGDTAALGGTADAAWLVDLFGHISQVPQLLSMAGVDAAYVWRGVPAMHPAFDWVGPDGSQVLAVDLFGGYRNLYGITRTGEIATDRLVAETRKLEPHYGARPIPLFDGYDLDTAPEDPVRHYEAVGGVPDDIAVHPSSPRRYLEAVSNGDAARPTIEGELLSGRYGATFPGTLSSRTYLKVLHHDAEQAVLRRAEPLAAMAASCGRAYPAAWFERTSRELLRNGVHDCICGVSIDQVHERMERSYRNVIDAAAREIDGALECIMAGLGPGRYAVSTSGFAGEHTQRVDGLVVSSVTDGIGITPVAETARVDATDERVDRFAWSNDHFAVEIDRDGVRIDGRDVARLVVRRDDGDTYSSEPGALLGRCTAGSDPVIESRSTVDVVVRLDTRLAVDGIDVRATVRLRLDAGPVAQLDVELDSDGSGFRVDAEFETAIASDSALVAMPFDLVERVHVDRHLLPHDIEPALASVLMGQREVGAVDEFPMHDFVALRSHERTAVAFGRGIRSYRSTPDGTLSLALRRSVEWVARTGLEHRQGDAGPALYVPGARCERSVRHELGFALLSGAASAAELWRISDGFHLPPLIVDVGSASAGAHDGWQVFREDLPVAGVERGPQGVTARIFNPEMTPCRLRLPRRRRSTSGDDLGVITEVSAGTIVDVAVPSEPPWADDAPSGSGPPIVVHGLPDVRVGRDRARPDPTVLDELEARQRLLERQLEEVALEVGGADGDRRYGAIHRRLVLDRERAELALSLELNRRLAVSDGIVSIPDEIDAEIARLGRELNELRIERRIYDYVVAML